MLISVLFLGQKDRFEIDLEDEVVRGSIVLQDGQLMWPPPAKAAPPPAAVSATKVEAAKVIEPDYFMNNLKDAAKYSAGL